jgi:type I restriction enzyme M protein
MPVIFTGICIKYVEAEILKNVLCVMVVYFQLNLVILSKKALSFCLRRLDITICSICLTMLIEAESTQLKGILPKTYTSFRNDLLKELLRIFNNSSLNEINDDILGSIYEYFLSICFCNCFR